MDVREYTTHVARPDPARSYIIRRELAEQALRTAAADVAALSGSGAVRRVLSADASVPENEVHCSECSRGFYPSDAEFEGVAYGRERGLCGTIHTCPRCWAEAA